MRFRLHLLLASTLLIALFFAALPSAHAINPPTSLQAQANGSVLRPTFTWVPQPDHLKFKVSVDPANVSGALEPPSSPWLDVSGFCSGTPATCRWTTSALTSGTYQWTVTVDDGQGNQAQATPQQFTIDSAPRVANPVSNGNIGPKTRTLRWDPVQGATGYIVHVADRMVFDSSGRLRVELQPGVPNGFVRFLDGAAFTEYAEPRITGGEHFLQVTAFETDTPTAYNQFNVRALGSPSQVVRFIYDAESPRVMIRPTNIGGNSYIFNAEETSDRGGVDWDNARWDFGDGSRQNGGSRAAHGYGLPTAHLVTLTVPDLAGNQGFGAVSVGTAAAPSQQQPAQGGAFSRVWMYPNPVYPTQDRTLTLSTGRVISQRTTSFCFTTPRAGNIWINIYNYQGLVARFPAKPLKIAGKLYKSWLPAGRYYVGWTAKNQQGRLLPAGTYKYTLELWDGKQTATHDGTVTVAGTFPMTSANALAMAQWSKR